LSFAANKVQKVASLSSLQQIRCEVKLVARVTAIFGSQNFRINNASKSCEVQYFKNKGGYVQHSEQEIPRRIKPISQSHGNHKVLVNSKMSIVMWTKIRCLPEFHNSFDCGRSFVKYDGFRSLPDL